MLAASRSEGAVTMREAQIAISPEEYAALGVDDLVSLCLEAGIADLEELECTGNGGLVQVSLERRVDEEQLDSLEYVYQWEFIGERGDEFIYIIGFVAPELPEEMSEHADDLIAPVDPDVGPEGATMSLIGPQEAIRSMVRAFLETGVQPDLRSLGEFEGTERPLAQLTDRQREVIQTAYDAGYYDVPRSASTEQLASRLGIDPSTVSEHLQRAERNLLTDHLSERTEAP